MWIFLQSEDYRVVESNSKKSSHLPESYNLQKEGLLSLDQGFCVEGFGMEELKKDLVLNRNDPSIRLYNLLKTKNKQLSFYKMVQKSQEDKIEEFRKVIESFKLKIINIVGYSTAKDGSLQDIPEGVMPIKAIQNLHRFVDKIVAFQINEGAEQLNQVVSTANEQFQDDLEKGLRVDYTEMLAEFKQEQEIQSENQQMEYVESHETYVKIERNFLLNKSHSFNQHDRVGKKKLRSISGINQSSESS